MEFTAKMIADFLQGEITGNPEAKVETVAKIEEGKEGALSFLANPKYEKHLYTTESTIVLINKDFVLEREVQPTLIKVENAYEAFASLLQLYEQSKPRKKGIHPSAVIETTAEIGENVYVGPFVYIGEKVKIGNDCQIYPHTAIGDGTVLGEECVIYSGVHIYQECILGRECIVHAGAVIGSDGFGFAPQNDRNYKKIPQIGNVILQDRVEIGANVTIDRATMGSTLLEEGVKLDNLNHIAHNVVVGSNTVMAAQCGVAGSTKIGKNVMFGGQVGVAPHIEVANGVKAAAMSGIAGTVKKEDSIIMGAPAIDVSDFRKSFVYYKNLPKIVSRLNELERKLKEIGKD